MRPLFLLLPVPVWGGEGAPDADPPLALVGATLVDGTGAPPLPDAVVVLEEGRIRCAGPRDACPIPANRAMGREGEMGTLETGKAADLVILSADPLVRIPNLRAVEEVFRGGVSHPRSQLEWVHGGSR